VGNERYRLGHEVGAGDDAFVYDATDTMLERRVAIRFLNASPTITANILAEARVLARATHQNVVRVHDVTRLVNPKTGIEADCLVMEFVVGRNLEELFADGVFSAPEALQLGRGLIEAIKHLHANNIYHGDVHEANVIISTQTQAPVFIDVKYWGELAEMSTRSRASKIGGDLDGLCRCLVGILQRALGPLPARRVNDALRRRRPLNEIQQLFEDALAGEPPGGGSGTGDGGPSEAAPGGDVIKTVDRALTEFTGTAIKRWLGKVSALADDDPRRMPRGKMIAAYALIPPAEFKSMRELLGVMQKAQGTETGWPVWWVPNKKGLSPYVADEQLECWMGDTPFDDPAHSDFWVAHPAGMLYLLRGYQEDGSRASTDSGPFFDLTIPVWRTAEIVRHAARFAKAAGSVDEQLITLILQWNGLDGRELRAWAEQGRILMPGRTSKTNKVERAALFTQKSVRTDLVGIVHKLLVPLYEAFDFFELSTLLVEQELEKMLPRRDAAE
jgi:tRNA A-37 threonylcarbamoyl transferase component Bud32